MSDTSSIFELVATSLTHVMIDGEFGSSLDIDRMADLLIVLSSETRFVIGVRLSTSPIDNLLCIQSI